MRNVASVVWLRLVLGLGGSFLGCGEEDPAPPPETKAFPWAEAQQAITTYKAIAYGVYGESVAGAKKLQSAVDAFVAAPDEAKLAAAKQAWIDARIPYNQNDVFRFYGGPIDHEETGPEGAINAWPLDENFIDYTRDEPNAGIINHPEKFPIIDEALIEEQNEQGGEKNISSGFHAIAFLLWGQDDETAGTGPGKRPFTDFVDGGTATNQARRRAYLKAAAALLVKHLEQVEAAWKPGIVDNYAANFGVKPSADSTTGDGVKDALARMIRGIGSMAKAELAGERMTVAFKNRSQEDEHSCFSDTTWFDLRDNALGLQNVWLGQYRGQKVGPGLDVVFRAVDAPLADTITRDLATAVDKLTSLAAANDSLPFDVMLAEPDGSPARVEVLEVIKALRSAADGLSLGAARLGLTISLEQPSEEL
ncbi:MAG: imelysin family protein [Myxococcales bacterium]|nr:iron-regulated protein [Polyangiaceae bacterium]MDW8249204.1 imelysin family protein [Myxococcales bacterium]